MSGPGTVPSARPDDAPVVCVVVTYRRRELLATCVDAILAQSRPPDVVLVIDNDHLAKDVLAGADARVVVKEMDENVGPAGGYERGFRDALELGAGAIWAVDDDVEPAPDCLGRLLGAHADVAVPLQRKPGGVRGFPPSWNGPLFDARVVRTVGLPRGDLFFWAEDTEYVHRCREAGFRRTHVPGAEVLHRNPRARSRREARDWQLYYEVRNALEYRLRIRRRSVRGVARAVGGVAGKLLSIVVVEPSKRRSLGLWWKGVRDFAAGRLGKGVDPSGWGGPGDLDR
jgi:GT2 family glycosyltransferase